MSGDGVYRSTDDGASFEHVGLRETRHIGRIWVDPRDAGTVLVAALGHVFGPNRERGVFRTEDGGRTWTALREGLPQEHAYDIPYRHALDVSADGLRLCFGTISGNVYISEDRGESWQTVGTGFPLVYSVEFF